MLRIWFLHKNLSVGWSRDLRVTVKNHLKSAWILVPPDHLNISTATQHSAVIYWPLTPLMLLWSYHDTFSLRRQQLWRWEAYVFGSAVRPSVCALSVRQHLCGVTWYFCTCGSGFQWSLTQVINMWVAVAENILKVRGQCQGYSEVTKIFPRDAIYLRNKWRNFNETWHKYSPYKWALLKRFSRSEVKDQGHS